MDFHSHPLHSRVDLLELAEIVANWGQTEVISGDFNDDGIIDIEDLRVVAEGWLACGRLPVETCLR